MKENPSKCPIYFGTKNPIHFEATRVLEDGTVEEYRTQDEKLANQLILPNVTNSEAWLNGVSNIIKENKTASIIDTVQPVTQMVRAEQTRRLYDTELNVSNFKVEPIQKIIVVDEKGKEVSEKEKILCKFCIIGHRTKYFEILTSEIGLLCKIIKKRYSAAIIDYEVKHAEKSIEMNFRAGTTYCTNIYCYCRQGWQIVNGKNVYLYDGKYLGENIRIETGATLPRYDYSKRQVGETLLYALELYSNPISISTMLAYAMTGVLYRAFVEAGFPPRFALFLNGQTGSMKTTIAQILYTQLCKDSDRGMPRRIDADTIVSFERAVIMSGRDTVTILDDYSPAKTSTKKKEMQDKLESIIRMVGDRSTKHRSNTDLKECSGEGVQGMVVITGELMGKGVSSNLRCLYCKMRREEANEEAITWFQNNPFGFTTVIANFAEFVGENWNDIVVFIRTQFIERRESMKVHLRERRLVDSAVTLLITNDIIKKFMVLYCGMDKIHMETICENIANGIIQNAYISQELSVVEAPSISFIKAVDELMRINQIVLNTDKIMQTETSAYDGFEDNKYFYFNPELVYKKVIAFLAQTNRYFSLDMREVFVALYDEGIIKASSNGAGKKTYCARISVGNGKKLNFLKIDKEVFVKALNDSIDEIHE